MVRELVRRVCVRVCAVGANANESERLRPTNSCIANLEICIMVTVVFYCDVDTCVPVCYNVM